MVGGSSSRLQTPRNLSARGSPMEPLRSPLTDDSSSLQGVLPSRPRHRGRRPHLVRFLGGCIHLRPGTGASLHGRIVADRRRPSSIRPELPSSPSARPLGLLWTFHWSDHLLRPQKGGAPRLPVSRRRHRRGLLPSELRCARWKRSAPHSITLLSRQLQLPLPPMHLP